MSDSSLARNPILPTPDAADAHIEMIGDRYYVYPTNGGIFKSVANFHSGSADEDQSGFVTWSSTDLTNWKSEGPILRLADVPWAKGLGDAWAPCLAERNGRYYFYYSAKSRIGVAVSDSPAGPFRDVLGEPLIPFADDLSSIDPMVYIDDDGQAYMYWGAVPGSWLHGKIDLVNESLFVRKLADDMISFAGPIVRTVATPRPPGGAENQYGPHIEGSHVLKRNGIYYLMWSRGNWTDTGDAQYHIVYATSRSPLGPWAEGAQPVLVSHPEINVWGPGHHSVLQIPGTDEWYLCYHCHSGEVNGAIPRRINLDRMMFAADGSIPPVTPTREGVAPHPILLALQIAAKGPLKIGQAVTLHAQILAGADIVRTEFVAQTGGKEIVLGEGKELNWIPQQAEFHRLFARGYRADNSVAAVSSASNYDVVA